MTSDWITIKAVDFIDFNPKLSLKKGSVSTKIAMDKLQPFTKKIPATEKAEFSGGAKFCNGDTIMARITPCLENGKTAFVDVLEDGEVGFGSTEFIVLRAKEGISDPQFIYYLATSPWFRNVAIKSMVGSSGRQRVQQGVLDELELTVPSLPEQQKIGAFLAMFDEKIALNNKINDNLQQQTVTIFREWFATNPESEKWPLVTLDSLTSLISRGITPKYTDDSTQIVLNQKCIRDHYIDVSLGRRHKPKVVNEKWLQNGDLLINSTGEGTLGRAAQVWFVPENMTADSHITIVRPKNRLLLFYIGLWGISHEREIEALHTGSTGQTELPRERVKAMKLPLPDNDTLTRFNAVIEPLVSMVIANQQENVRLTDIRDSLLHKLMSGEIDVSNINI